MHPNALQAPCRRRLKYPAPNRAAIWEPHRHMNAIPEPIPISQRRLKQSEVLNRLSEGPVILTQRGQGRRSWSTWSSGTE